MLQAGKAWKRIEAGGRKPTWSEWTISIGPGLVQARAEAMGITGTSRPVGRAYNAAMSALLKEYGLDDIHETRRGHLLKIMHALHEIEAWRAREDTPDNLNNPSTVWTRYQQSAKHG